MKLRYYQSTAVQRALFEWLPNNDGGCLIVMPTGTGKSIVIARIAQIVMDYPDQRIIVATHSQELVEQDYLEFMELCQFANAAIYCAGLKQKNTTARVLFVSIQSVYNKALKLGRCDILIADEAHGISRRAESMWGQFIKELSIPNPQMRLIGTTATDYRLDSGNLIGGDGALFHGIAYEYSLLEAIEDGYLCELIPPPKEVKLTRFDISNVHKRGGEYIPGELEKAVNIDSVTRSAIDEMLVWGSDRKSWIVFGAGIKHCNSICAEIKARGISCEVITNDTSKPDRREFIRKFKNYEIQALVSKKILTTGFNHKGVDLIADMDPTGSKGLHVQKWGRGTRAIYANGFDLETRKGRLAAISASTKPNCLVLDYARNGSRFGPIDQIKGNDFKEKGSGEAPIKNCPKCHAVMYAGAMECPDCGYLFPENPPEITKTASDAPILSTQIKPIEPITHIVFNTTYSRHLGKDGKPDSFRAKYSTYTGDYSEFVFFEHLGRAREKACFWHRKLLPNMPAPNSIEAALKMPYPQASEVEVRKNGKFWEVVSVKYKEDVLAEILPPIDSGLADFDTIPF